MRDVKSGRADFTQAVTVARRQRRKKTSSGHFEFARPNRFRFAYTKPFEQIIVADGQKVWIYDADLNQVSSRKPAQALGATPAALLAGGSTGRATSSSPRCPTQDGLQWVKATPKAKDGAFQSLSIGFRGKELAALEIVGQLRPALAAALPHIAANVPIRPSASSSRRPRGRRDRTVARRDAAAAADGACAEVLPGAVVAGCS